MTYKRFQAYFFVILLAASLILTLLVFRPYFMPLALGAVLAVIFRPLYHLLHRLLRSDIAAAFLTTIVAALVLVLPMVYFFAALYAELSGSYGSWRGLLDIGAVRVLLQRWLTPDQQQQVLAVVGNSAGFLQTGAERILGNLFSLFGNALAVLLGFVVMLLSLYYLLKDGARIKRELLVLSPLNDEYDELVIRRLVTAAGAVVNGFVVIGLAKGVIAGVCFWLVGLPAPFFWGTMTGLSWFMPIFGSALIMLPAAGYMMMTGHLAAGIIILIVLAALVHPVDNLLQPFLVGAQISTHPLLVLLSVVGGLQFFGFSGFIFGPMALAATMALLDIYKKDFRRYIENV